MDLALQFGYGMGQLAVELTRRWQLTQTILSPRDLDDQGLATWAQRLNSSTGLVLLDPQFYMARADHERLTNHLYWPQDYDSDHFYEHGGLESMVTNLFELNLRLETSQMILPGTMAQPVSDSWLGRQRATLAVAQRAINGRMPLAMTICMSAESLRDIAQVQLVLEQDRELDYLTAYVVVEHPNQSYRVHDPVWLANLLELTTGLKLHSRRVIVGYCQHQALILAAAAVDVVTSGTWMNVRSFVPGKFVTALQDEIAQRQTWYFCARSMSEYTIPYLDIAYRAGLLDDMAPQAPLPVEFAALLFRGTLPTSVEWGEAQAFRHYLATLRTMARGARQSTFQTTVDSHLAFLDSAETLDESLRRAGILAGTRDFHGVFDAHRSALAIHARTRGVILSREWDRL